MKPRTYAQRQAAIQRITDAGHSEEFARFCVDGGWDENHPQAQLRWQVQTFYKAQVAA